MAEVPNQNPSGRNGSEDPNDPGRRPRSYTGYVLVVLILVITVLVVRKSIGEPSKVSYPQFVKLALEGKVESVEIRKNTAEIEYKENEGDRGQKGTVAIPEHYMTEKARDFEEMAALGRQAVRRADTDVDALYVHFKQIADGEIEPDFAVYKRYVFQVGGVSKLLVKMSRPAFGATPGVHYQNTPEAYLFEDTHEITVPAGPDTTDVRKVSVSFDDLLLATNTVQYNARLGLPAPSDLTVEVWTSPDGTVTWAEGETIWQTLVVTLLPWLLIIAFLWFFVFRQMRSGGVGGNVLSFGRSRAKMANKERSKVTFKDVAGVDEAKQEVAEIVEFLKNPKQFARLGGRTPRGVLQNGSPGTGKTLLAKAIAGEADVPFFSISGSDFVEMFVGVGASRVRDLFKQARDNAPCIIFLDEIDAVGRRRGAGLGGGHDEREQTLNAILVEMDGFDTETGIIVIAATNRVDVLDPALLRPGRFDRQINVDLPDLKGREAILAVHAKKVRMHPSVDLEKIGRGTPGFSGAELEAVVNEAAILATLAKKDYVYEEDLEEARDRVRWGRAKTSRIMDESDKRVTAYHEAGHAITAYFREKADPLHKVTIIPRGPALGVTMFLPERDRYGMTRGQIEAYLEVCFGGRVAEEIFCGDITSGAANDIKQATGLARRMVQEWGMADGVGPINYDDHEENPFLGRDIGRQTRLSDATAQKIDAEIERIIDAAYRRCRELIEVKRAEVELLAEALLTYETLEREEIDGLLSGTSIEEVRARVARNRSSFETDAKPARPAPKPDPRPEPDLPPGLAGEGAH
ncbi:MAG: ATP-dependent zinc metalloprotease FtsH [Planctomycetota bacterium]